MKSLALAVFLAGIMLVLNGCAVYVPQYSQPDAYYGYAPYGGYNYGFYGNYGFRPRYYGWGWGGGHHRWH